MSVGSFFAIMFVRRQVHEGFARMNWPAFRWTLSSLGDGPNCFRGSSANGFSRVLAFAASPNHIGVLAQI